LSAAFATPKKARQKDAAEVALRSLSTIQSFSGSAPSGSAKNPKSELNEYWQKRYHCKPPYQISNLGSDHAPQWKVTCN
jgi:dsRNA-specific ribonuclease